MKQAMARFAPTAAILFLVAGGVFGQPADKALAFQFVSVVPGSAPVPTRDENPFGRNASQVFLASMGIRVSGGRVDITGNSLRDLIRLAYQVKDYQIDAPERLAKEFYDINAVMPAGSSAGQAPEMLRSLLADKFHLKLHRETRDMEVFALAAGSRGATLIAATPGRGWVAHAADGRVAVTGPVEQFADLLGKTAGAPVIDQTGIAGNYDFDLRFRPAWGTVDERPTLEQALDEQYGLKLVKQKMSIEVLMVDSAYGIPAGN